MASRTAPSYRIYVTDARGLVVFDSAGRDVGKDYSRWNDVYLTLRGRYGARSTRSDPDDEASSVMHVAAPIRNGSEIIGVLTVAKPNQAIAPSRPQPGHGAALGPGADGAALLIGVLAAWWLSRQLGALRRYANAVTAGERATLPDTAGEFGDLGRALETMRDKLEGKQYVEQYVHTLTHELKSPLAAIRGSAELLEHADKQQADNEQAENPASWRTVGRSDADDGGRTCPLHRHHPCAERATVADDRQTAGTGCSGTSPAHRTAAAGRDDRTGARSAAAGDPETGSTRHRLRTRRRRGAAVGGGDVFLLRQALHNLLDNAADFAPADSTVELHLRASRRCCGRGARPRHRRARLRADSGV